VEVEDRGCWVRVEWKVRRSAFVFELCAAAKIVNAPY